MGFPVDTSKLRIEKTAIQRIPSEAFNYLSSLEFLWMSFNTLSALNPDSFRGLFNLEELRLDGNALTAFPWESIMDMPSLRLLDLHNNQLTSLPAEATIYIKNLTYLDLSSNNLLTLPVEVLSTWLAVKPAQGPESSKMILGKGGCTSSHPDITHLNFQVVVPQLTIGYRNNVRNNLFVLCSVKVKHLDTKAVH